MVNGPYARWQELAAYWVGQRIDSIKPEFKTNARPHSLTPSKFYDMALKAYRRFKIVGPDVLVAGNGIKIRSIYKTLIMSETQTPVIQAKFPIINFVNVWKRAISPRPREVGWRLVHNKLYCLSMGTCID